MVNKLTTLAFSQRLKDLKKSLTKGATKVNRKKGEYVDAQVDFAEKKIEVKAQADELRATADAIDVIVAGADEDLADD